MLHTLFSLPGNLDNQCSEFLKSVAYLDFGDFPNLIKYYTTIRGGTLFEEEYTTIKNGAVLKDIKNFMYLTQPNFSEDAPNQILHMLSTLILWSKTFYTTTGQYPTPHDLFAITPEEISCWKYYLAYPNKCVKPKLFLPTVLLPSLYSGRCYITSAIQVNP